MKSVEYVPSTMGNAEIETSNSPWEGWGKFHKGEDH